MYVKHVCTHTHIHINTKALPNKARGCWEPCHKERWRLEVTKNPAPSISKSRSLHNLQFPAGSQEWSQQGKRDVGSAGVCLFSDHPWSQDLKAAVAFVLKGAVK